MPAEEHPLRPLLEPASIAVVGASAREGSIGWISARQAMIGGFGGPVYPVNPRYDAILDTACYPRLADLPEPAELVVLAVGNERIEGQLVHALENGARAAVIFASAYLEHDTEPPLVERLRAIASEAGVPVCGANCLGLSQLEAGVRATWSDYDALEPGPIAMISHSGTAYYALAGIDPRLRYNLIVSPGQELVTTSADYLDYAAGLESTRVVGLFIETIRDPEGFRAALEKALARGIPVVALKVGRTELSARLAKSHSGALAGNDAAYEALFEQCGVQRVHSIDELSATLALFAAYPRLGPGGLAAVHDSGGLRGMVIDLAHRAGVPYARIGADATAALARTLAYGLPAANPVDAWSGFDGFRETFSTCLDALARDPDTALTCLFTDIASGDAASFGLQYLPAGCAERTGRPVALALNWSRACPGGSLLGVTRKGVPVLDGAENALLAIRHAFAYRDFRSRPPVIPPPAPEAAVVAKWRERLTGAGLLDEAESSALLADFGVPTLPARVAGSLEEACEAASVLGYPVALKTAAPGIRHKTDAGGVALRLSGEAALARAYTDVAERLGPRVRLSPMADPGVEMAIGLVVDDQFGPLVMVAAGGVLIEVLNDRCFLLPPIDEATAGRALDRLRAKRLLDGVRGQEPADRRSLCRAVARLGVLASTLGDRLAEVDVNPLVCGPGGCVAVDALVVPRSG